MSLARRHRERMLAARQAAASDPLPRDATPYQILLAAMGQHLAELKSLQSVEAKISRKAEIVGDYEPWVEGVLDAAKADDFRGDHDEIVSQVLVWELDVGNFAKALAIAAHVLRYGLALPERFKRTAATMVAEEIADAGLKAAGQGEHFELAVLQQADALTADEDMPDEVRAKLKKAIGLELARIAADLPEEGADGAAGGRRAAVEAALDMLRRALALNSKAGVKKEIERLEREAKRLAEPPTT